MIYLGNLEINNKDIAKVGLVNYQLFFNLTPKQRLEYENRGVFVEALPEKIFDDNEKISNLYIDLNSKKVWYEYEDIPPSQEELDRIQIDNISKQLFDTQTELLKSKSENELLGQQFFNLQTTLVEKGVM